MTTTSDHAPGVSYGDFAWQDRPDLAPQTGHGVYVCGEITSYQRVDEEEGEVGQERHVLVHGFDLRVPQRGAEPVSDFLIGLAKALSSDADPRNREEAQQCILHIQQKMRAAAKKGAS